jgi:hypothetical protein
MNPDQSEKKCIYALTENQQPRFLDHNSNEVTKNLDFFSRYHTTALARTIRVEIEKSLF